MTARRTVLGVALTALALLAAVLIWTQVVSDRYVARPPDAAASAVDPAAAAQVLRDLETAIADGDAEAAEALAPPGDGRAEGLLAAVVENAEALHVEDFSARYVDAVGGADADGRWQAAVDVAWRFDGFDDEPVREEVLVSFGAGPGDAPRIVSFGGGDRRSPLWLSGPLEVRRSADTLVLATSAADADVLAQRAVAAVPVVRAVLPAWPGRLVVEVPGSEPGLAAALGAEAGTYADIAAVTASVDGSLAPGAPVHVFVNPDVYDDLDPVGGQVVVSHEATHAATSAPLTSGVPLWLLEGFADYVALRDVDLPISTTAAQVIAQVQDEGAPEQLPDQADFEATDSHLGAAYESAWLACVELADRGGQQALVQLYEQVSRGRDLGTRLQALFDGLSVEGLTARWRQRLTDLAAATTDGA